jgi:hypothetical protein
MEAGSCSTGIPDPGRSVEARFGLSGAGCRACQMLRYGEIVGRVHGIPGMDPERAVGTGMPAGAAGDREVRVTGSGYSPATCSCPAASARVHAQCQRRPTTVLTHDPLLVPRALLFAVSKSGLATTSSSPSESPRAPRSTTCSFVARSMSLTASAACARGGPRRRPLAAAPGHEVPARPRPCVIPPRAVVATDHAVPTSVR